MGLQRSIFGWISYLSRALVCVVIVVPWYFVSGLVGTFRPAAGLRTGVAANRFLLRLFGIDVVLKADATSLDRSAGAIYVLLNQTSLLDGTIGSIVIPLPFRAITNIEYALIPVFGWFATIYGWVIVRQWPAQAKRAMSKIGTYVENGGNVYVSIEGKRSRDGSLCPYKKGPAVLAIRLGAPLIPMYFMGAHDCLPYGAIRIRPGRVTVKFLRPVPTEGLTYEDRDSLVAQLRAVAENEMQRESA